MLRLASSEYRAVPRGFRPDLTRLIGQTLRLAAVVAALTSLAVGFTDPRVQRALEPVPALRPATEASIHRLQVADDGRTVWVTSSPGRLRNVDLATGRVLIDLFVPEGLSPAPLCTADGFQVMFLSHGGQPLVQRLDYEDGPVALRRERTDLIDRFAINPGGDRIVLQSNEALELCSGTGPDRRHVIVTQDRRCSALAWAPDGTQLLVAEEDGWLSLRDGRTLAELARIPSQIECGVRAGWSQDGRFALAFGVSGPIAVWDTHSPAASPRHLEFECRSAAALSPDGSQLAVCDTERQFWLINVADPSDRFCLDRLPASANAICYTPGGDRLLVGTMNGDLLCWSLLEERLLWTSGPGKS
ncbi:MAG TPA: WD40 repeat domain-containing protein [Planctomycetaceae bacterium]|nr:WD40 repeat domain-containing protein [Planctomycetaceae bacterium]